MGHKKFELSKEIEETYRKESYELKIVVERLGDERSIRSQAVAF